MTSSQALPTIAGTLQTDPRSGGIKKSSGVNVLPVVITTWTEVRDNNNSEVEWLIAGYAGASKTDVTILKKGKGGVAGCAQALPTTEPVFGGCRLKSTGRFMSFYYSPDGVSIIKRGRASLHKNGVLNVFEGCDGELDMNPNLASSTI